MSLRSLLVMLAYLFAGESSVRCAPESTTREDIACDEWPDLAYDETYNFDAWRAEVQECADDCVTQSITSEGHLDPSLLRGCMENNCYELCENPGSSSALADYGEPGNTIFHWDERCWHTEAVACDLESGPSNECTGALLEMERGIGEDGERTPIFEMDSSYCLFVQE